MDVKIKKQMNYGISDPEPENADGIYNSYLPVPGLVNIPKIGGLIHISLQTTDNKTIPDARDLSFNGLQTTEDRGHLVRIHVHDVGRPHRGAPTQPDPNNSLSLPGRNAVSHTPAIFCYWLRWM